MKHPIYTEKSNISFEKYEPNNDSCCNINCCSRFNNDGICCTSTAFACHVGCGVPYPVPVPVPVPVFGGFFVHKTIIKTIHQVNNCTGNGDQKWYGNDHQDHNQKDKQKICLNTAVNTAGRGPNGVGSGPSPNINPIG